MKIYPGQKMSFALAAFLMGYYFKSRQGVQRLGEYRITSKEYQRIREMLSIESSLMQKEKWKNKTQEEIDDWKRKHLETLKNRSVEQKKKTLQKYRETLKNRTKEDWEKIRQKRKENKQNKTKKELLEMHNNLSKNTKGKTWFNNGDKEILCFDCPEGFVKGRLPNPESRIKAGITNKERNKVRGSSQSRMTEEQYKLWKQHIKEHHANGKEVQKSMPEETKKTRAEKISKSLKGKKHSENRKKNISEGIFNSPKHFNAVKKSAEAHKGKKFFNNGEKTVLAETCPDGFTPGLLRKNKKSSLKKTKKLHLV